MSAEKGPLAGNFYIVTGGSRGIGRATALKLAENGGLVGVTSTSEAGVIEANEALGPYGGFAKELKYRWGQEEAVYEDVVAQMIAEAEERFRDTEYASARVALKGVINNAGMTDNNNFMSLTAEGWRQLFETNVIGPSVFTKFAAKHMRKVDASVTWVGSAAKFGHKGQASYSGSKAALEGISPTLAVDLEKWGIRSNVVRLGLVDTDMTRGDLTDEQFADIEGQVPDGGKAFTPEQAADVIYDVVTGDKNGEVIVFDGGLSDTLASN